jgi:hypothetical protein
MSLSLGHAMLPGIDSQRGPSLAFKLLRQDFVHTHAHTGFKKKVFKQILGSESMREELNSGATQNHQHNPEP